MNKAITDSTSLAIFDCEVYPNYFLLCLQKKSDGKNINLELKGDNAKLNHDERKSLLRMLKRLTTIGFNSMKYDLPIITYAIDGATCIQIYEMSQWIIDNNAYDWQTYQEFGMDDLNLSHIDLMGPSPGVMASLKLYAGRMHTKKLGSLPIAPDATLSTTDRQKIKNYCLNDLVMTRDLYVAIEERIELRSKMSEHYKLNLMSKSDAQIAEAIIRSKLDIGKVVNDIPATVTYTAPEYIRFTTPELQATLTLLTHHQFEVNDEGNIKQSIEITRLKLNIGDTSYKLGIGGLHSEEKSMTVIPDSHQLLLDRDVTAYYPSLIIGMGLFPKATGKEFLSVYEDIVKERVRAKRAGDTTVNASLKIVINGLFGKLGNRYSAVYSPDLLLAVTLTGQLSLLMLIERLEANGISVVSANTDGVVSLLSKTDRELFNDICDQWEVDTGLNLEETGYKALYAKDVNNYFALTTLGEEKRKGVFAHTGLNKNPANTVCINAVVEFIKNGTPIASTINNCTDIRQFLRLQRVNGGATWRGDAIGC